MALSAASKFLVVDIPYIEIPILHENANKGHVIMVYEAKQQAR
jgi:hypothetical protein